MPYIGNLCIKKMLGGSPRLIGLRRRYPEELGNRCYCRVSEGITSGYRLFDTEGSVRAGRFRSKHNPNYSHLDTVCLETSWPIVQPNIARLICDKHAFTAIVIQPTTEYRVRVRPRLPAA